MYTISSDQLKLKVSEMGGEMKSLCWQGKEYLWHGDAAYWGRSAPVLFPLVGSLRGKQYRYEGETYSMGQHGFARDQQFQLVEQEEDRIRFRLCDSEETRKQYPFAFQLDLEYVLQGREVTVNWIVKNTDTNPLFFSLGGHPAFLCSLITEEGQKGYSLKMTKEGAPVERLERTVLGEGGLALREKEQMECGGGVLPLTLELFDRDALVFENHQIQELALYDPEGREMLRVEYDAPLVGIWSPVGKNAPFVCLEPWYGRCDGEDFKGTLQQREWGNRLEPGEEFCGGFRICFPSDGN